MRTEDMVQKTNVAPSTLRIRQVEVVPRKVFLALMPLVEPGV